MQVQQKEMQDMSESGSRAQSIKFICEAGQIRCGRQFDEFSELIDHYVNWHCGRAFHRIPDWILDLGTAHNRLPRPKGRKREIGA